MKDQDFVQMNMRIELGPEKRELLKAQIKQDVKVRTEKKKKKKKKKQTSAAH